MGEIKLVIAESEELFKKNLINYLSISNSNFSIASMSSRKELTRFLSDGRADILLLDESLYAPELEPLISGGKGSQTAKIILYGNIGSSFLPDGWEHINKYQKMESLLQDIQRVYTEAAKASVNSRRSGAKTRIISFYSPVGGSGKTTLTLGCALAFAKRAEKVFYLNFEKISSTGVFMDAEHTENLSDVLSALKDDSSIMYKLRSARISDQSQIDYFNPPDSGMPLGKLEKPVINKLIDGFIGYNEYNYVMIDLSSDFSAVNMAFLERSEVVVLPIVPGEIARKKLELFSEELDLRYKEHIPRDRFITVLNKIEEGMPEQDRHSFPVQLMVPYMSELSGITRLNRFWGVLEQKMNHLADIISHSGYNHVE